MRMYDIIEKKRDEKELSYEEIEYFIKGYCENKVEDYQASALLMAIFLNGMSEKETAELTEIMANSGEVIDLSEIDGIKVDKHSTGGVGDKTTLIIGPIVSALGVPVAKMSGKGLGHTGGTIDKMESIKGLQTNQDIKSFIESVKKIGICLAGQTGNLAPADKKLYALRDVTATVNNMSLIASSIMSKKIASGADRIVLDVKMGSGAFMKDLDDAIELSKIMVSIAKRVGRKAVAVVTNMDIPLGKTIGNSLEVIEAIDVLKGKGPDDLREVSFFLAEKMVELSGLYKKEECADKVREVIENGLALKKIEELIENQGGDKNIVNNYDLFEKPQHEYEFKSKTQGYIDNIKTDYLGTTSMILGAGRETKECVIDYSAGIILSKKTGDYVEKGDVIAKLYTNKPEKVESAIKVLEEAVNISTNKPLDNNLILAYVDEDEVIKY